MSDKKHQLTVLRDRWLGCRLCDISKARRSKRIAFGMGALNARILIITEAPSEPDVEIGGALQDPDKRPLLEEFLKLANIPKSAIFVTSMVGCHPFYVIPATDNEESRVMPRPPSTSEVEACWSRVQETIYLMDPELIISMGESSWKKLVHTKDRQKCTTFRSSIGRLFVARVPGRLRELQYSLITAPSLERITSDPSAAEHGPPATLFRVLSNAWENLQTQKALYEGEQS